MSRDGYAFNGYTPGVIMLAAGWLLIRLGGKLWRSADDNLADL